LREKEIDFHREYTHKLKSVEKVSEMCVIDIYSLFVKSFHIQYLINDRNRGREKICLKAYNHHCPKCVINQYKQTTSEN